LAGRIRTGLDEVRDVATRTERIWAEARGSTDDWHVDAVALNLHGFYAGVERLLELIAEAVDEVKPAGGDWHRALLSQMASEISEVRPAVLAIATRNDLDRYRGFRHVVRNVYAFNLDPRQVGLLVDALSATVGMVAADLGAFADWLENVADDPAE
jgi:hypothetical protein